RAAVVAGRDLTPAAVDRLGVVGRHLVGRPHHQALRALAIDGRVLGQLVDRDDRLAGRVVAGDDAANAQGHGGPPALTGVGAGVRERARTMNRVEATTISMPTTDRTSGSSAKNTKPVRMPSGSRQKSIGAILLKVPSA